MNERFFLIDEKRETLRININRKKKRIMAICETCESRFDWLTVEEAAALFGADSEGIRRKLDYLRKESE